MPTWALRAGKLTPSFASVVRKPPNSHPADSDLAIVRALATRLKRQPVLWLVLVGWLLFRLPQRRLVGSLLFQAPPRKTKADCGRLSSQSLPNRLQKSNSKIFRDRLRRSLCRIAGNRKGGGLKVFEPWPRDSNDNLR